MAQHRPAVPVAIKRALLDEADGACANPGCRAYQVHIHHIVEWHVYQAHDPDLMIAICPNCHDAVHRGDLRIDDATLRHWKEIDRGETPVRRAVLIPEPGPEPKLLLGSIAVSGVGGVRVFDLNAGNRLGFSLEDNEIQLIGLVVILVAPGASQSRSPHRRPR